MSWDPPPSKTRRTDGARPNSLSSGTRRSDGPATRRSWKIGAFVAAAVSIGTLLLAAWQAYEAKIQYVASTQQSRYDGIVAGLTSKAIPVQINAIFRLVDFIDDPTNFSSSAEQQRTGNELAHTLVSYISGATRNTGTGLSDYSIETPRQQAAVVAAKELQVLLSNPRLAGDTISQVGLDHVDLHGFTDPNLNIDVDLSMVGVDLREAILHGININRHKSVNLTGADLSCADLYGTAKREASLGAANLSYADLTGANLDFLDLSHTSGLTLAQVRHVTYNSATRWPSTIPKPPPHDDMQSVQFLCTYMINRMTGMLPGEGYENVAPWPKISTHPKVSALESGALDVRRLRMCSLDHSISRVPAVVLADHAYSSVRQLVTTCPSRHTDH